MKTVPRQSIMGQNIKIYLIEWAFTWPSTTGHEVKSGLHSQWESENLILTKFRNGDLLLCSHVFLTSSTGQRHTVRSDF